MHTADAQSLTLFILGYCTLLQVLGLLLIWYYQTILRSHEHNGDLEEIPSGLSLCVGFFGGVTPLGFIFEKYGMEQNAILMIVLMLVSAMLVTYVSEKIFKVLADHLAPDGHQIKWLFSKETLFRLIGREV